MFYLTTHSTHFIYGYMASDIWLRTILIARKETRCRHIGYSYRLTARVLLYAPSHRQDNTYHSLCYTSHGALAGIVKYNRFILVLWTGCVFCDPAPLRDLPGGQGGEGAAGQCVSVRGALHARGRRQSGIQGPPPDEAVLRPHRSLPHAVCLVSSVSGWVFFSFSF